MLLQARPHAAHRASVVARDVGKGSIGIEGREELLVLVGTPLFAGVYTCSFAH
jgi:hypothetical protein